MAGAAFFTGAFFATLRLAGAFFAAFFFAGALLAAFLVAMFFKPSLKNLCLTRIDSGRQLSKKARKRRRHKAQANV
jgi:hypothetical protein